MRQTTSARQAVRVPPIKVTRPARASRPRQGAARSFLSLSDWSKADLTACLALAARMKTARAEGRRRAETPLSGRHVALLFDKPSLRTRVTFEVAVCELGGDPIDHLCLRGSACGHAAGGMYPRCRSVVRAVSRGCTRDERVRHDCVAPRRTSTRSRPASFAA